MEIVPAGEVIVALPEDLQSLDPLKDQERFVNTLVHKWNSIVEGVENQTIMFSKMVVKALEGQSEAVISTIVDKIKNHPDLRLTISKDRIWQGVRLIKTRPEIIEAPAISHTPDTIYRKKDGSKNYEFYFELYKYSIPDSMKVYFEYLGKERNWSVRELRENIEEYRQEKMEPSQKVRFQKRDDIKEIFKLIREMTPEGVHLAVTKVRELHASYKHTRPVGVDTNSVPLS